MWIKEALEVLPDLVLVDGSDLTHYRQFSSEISAVAQSFTPVVERLGLDENYVDITEIVGDYFEKSDLSNIEGHVYGDKEPTLAPTADLCGCGCQQRMVAGALVAKKLRQQIFEATGITCCAGIAHNKLLAKLVSGYYKPNQQTVLFPWLVHHLMNSLVSAKSIPGIGSSTFKDLEKIGISTVKDLQSSSLTFLQSKFDEETSKKLRDLSFGIDETPVRRSGRPQSIGLEDAFRKVNSIAEVRIKYSTLLERLLKLMKEDGRIPASLRVCVRKFDSAKKFGHRESRQAPIPSSLFKSGVQNISENTRTLLMEQVMGLFHKMVDTSKPYHLTLVAVGFNKFIERAAGEQSISRFFLKRKRSEPGNQDISRVMNEDPKHPKLYSAEKALTDSNNHSSEALSGEASSPKKNINSEVKHSDHSSVDTKTKHLEILRANSNKEIGHNDSVTEAAARELCCDITKYKNSLDIDNYDNDDNSSCEDFSVMDHSETQNPSEVEGTHPSSQNSIAQVPPDIDKEVFKALPPEIQDEVLKTYKGRPPDFQGKSQNMLTSPKGTHKRSVNPTLERYFKKTPTKERSGVAIMADVEEGNSRAGKGDSSVANSSSSSTNSNGTVPLPGSKDDSENVNEATVALPQAVLEPPDGVDSSVFNSLPEEIQREIVEEQKRSVLRASIPSKRPPSCRGRSRGSSSSSIMKYIKKV